MRQSRAVAYGALLAAACAPMSATPRDSPSRPTASPAPPAAGSSPARSASKPDPAAANASAPGASPEGAVPSPERDHFDLAHASGSFTARLYRELAKTSDDNFAFSPASIHLALAMTYAGARGETERQMRAALELHGLSDQVHGALEAELERWKAWKKEGTTLLVANRLFVDRTLRVEEPFLELTRARYAAAVESIDFLHRWEWARQHINIWVEKSTKRYIKALLPENSITPRTRMVLANALYMDAKWLHRFRKHNTKPSPFQLAAGSSVHVPTMHLEANLGHAKVHGFEVVELPYKGSNLAMLLLLPEGGALGELEKQLDASQLRAASSSLAETRVCLALPKFTIRPAGGVRLEPMLRELGMTDAFTQFANFSGITKVEQLFIDDVYHATYVKTDEEGTVAAAATGVVAEVSSSPPPCRHVRLSRPFVFLIRERESGFVLFAGRVADPTR